MYRSDMYMLVLRYVFVYIYMCMYIYIYINMRFSVGIRMSLFTASCSYFMDVIEL